MTGGLKHRKQLCLVKSAARIHRTYLGGGGDGGGGGGSGLRTDRRKVAVGRRSNVRSKDCETTQHSRWGCGSVLIDPPLQLPLLKRR